MPKILLIDDDSDFLSTVQMVLEAHGFSVEVAMTPAEGISKVKSIKPDLVILDVMMPTDYEGFDVARELRENLELIKLPILMLTSVHSVKKVPYRFTPDKEYLPVDVFRDKPIEPRELVDTIQGMLGTRREDPKKML